MLNKKYRLTRKQINILYRKGKSNNFGGISLKSYPNSLEYPRFSLVIPKSLVKKVTERNRLRRIIFDELGKTKGAAHNDYLIRLFKVEDELHLRARIKNIFGG